MGLERFPFRSLATVAIVVSWFVFTSSENQLLGQSQAKVDFGRDVQPLLNERCVGCHGPSQQMSGYRLDRRSAALGGVVRSNIVPGSSESSRLFRRVSGSQFGPQMPPAGPLSPVEVAIFKRWIDEGTQWPDVLANEADVPSPDPVATRLIEGIRQSDHEAVLRELAGAPSVVSKRGPEGATPLMYATLPKTVLFTLADEVGNSEVLREAIARGADVNVRDAQRAPVHFFRRDELGHASAYPRAVGGNTRF